MFSLVYEKTMSLPRSLDLRPRVATNMARLRRSKSKRCREVEPVLPRRRRPASRANAKQKVGAIRDLQSQKRLLPGHQQDGAARPVRRNGIHRGPRRDKR